ncbi:hypothetical protein M1O13_02080 [Dehalococcoidia bacterium]|nr:hypothetical protein [Dehalococcoidia bacterium]
MPNVEVTFTVAPEGAGIIYPTVVITDPQGVAEATITAIDVAEVTVTASVAYPPLEGTVGIRFLPQTYTIDLAVGWNLISLPLIPLDPAIETVLQGVEGIEIVWAYDAETGEWLRYTPAAGGTLTEMVDGKGYWIKMSAPATLTVSGFEMPLPPDVPPEYPVFEGWNLIGFRSLAPMSAGEYLAGVEWTKLWTFHQGVWTRLGPEDEMVPGRGYWLFATAAGTIAIAAE